NRQWPAALDDDIEDVFPKEHIIRLARESRKNLGRKIDLLQLHVWTDKWAEGAESKAWQDAFQQLKQEGVAEFFGVSVNDHAPETALKLAESGKVDSLQVIYNIFDQSPEDELLKIAARKKLGIIARVPFDEGALTGKLAYETKFDDWRKHYFGGERLKEADRQACL
ncbi:aldo/keto reductase, partial [Candidatus Woesearchaeota archaeon]|nr:aldo/keto reductase [Candidatus Woesearchaeota archaeon]